MSFSGVYSSPSLFYMMDDDEERRREKGRESVGETKILSRKTSGKCFFHINLFFLGKIPSFYREFALKSKILHDVLMLLWAVGAAVFPHGDS